MNLEKGTEKDRANGRLRTSQLAVVILVDDKCTEGRVAGYGDVVTRYYKCD